MSDQLMWIRSILSTTPERWIQLAETVPPDLMRAAPKEGEWSALECLQHLVDTEPVFQFRVDAFLAGRDFPAFDPDSQGTKPDARRTPADLAAEYAGRRAASLATLARLPPGDLDRQAIHQELGRVTLSEMVHEWAAHDLMHTVQAERALMQPFIRGSGPWLNYFKDHTVVEAVEDRP